MYGRMFDDAFLINVGIYKDEIIQQLNETNSKGYENLFSASSTRSI